MPEGIILYDIPSTLPGKAWSPNTWKARFALNYKGIPYKTVWVEYPDIQALAQKIGASATDKKPDGRDHYTLPIIQDMSTGKVVSDSLAICQYLDTAYPSTPQLFPPGTAALQAAFGTLIGPVIGFPALFICMERLIKGLNPASSTYFRETREAQFGKVNEAKVAESWKNLENGWARVRSFLDANGEGKNLTILGEKDKLTFADLAIVSFLLWVKICVGEDSEDWKRVTEWGNGFATKILAQAAKYIAVDE